MHRPRGSWRQVAATALAVKSSLSRLNRQSERRCQPRVGSRVVSGAMVVSDLSQLLRWRDTDFRGNPAIAAVAVLIGVLFAGSTLLTPLYVIYQERFGFAQITLTLIYAIYVAGN